VNIIEWAAGVKPDMVRLQQERGIPALFAAAQMCHESYNTGTGGLTELAERCHNYAGMKWADWQAEYGGSPVVYGTWEHINGQDQRMDAAFASFPSWEAWLRAYVSLLTSDRYKAALAYAADPLLYGLRIWQAGWATDPHYPAKLGDWMARLWEHYADTVRLQKRPPVPIHDPAKRLLCEGWLEDGTTVIPLRALCEALGLVVEWADGQVILRWPGRA